MNLLFLSPGMGEIGVVVLMVFLLFGGEQTPKIAQTLGKAIREIKKFLNDLKSGNGDD